MGGEVASCFPFLCRVVSVCLICFTRSGGSWTLRFEAAVSSFLRGGKGCPTFALCWLASSSSKEGSSLYSALFCFVQFGEGACGAHRSVFVDTECLFTSVRFQQPTTCRDVMCEHNDGLLRFERSFWCLVSGVRLPHLWKVVLQRA